MKAAIPHAEKRKLLSLLLTMLKIGLFTFGGGYAMIALLENEFVTRRKWIKHEEFLNMAAIAESTPGPIAINAATYIGYKQSGILGASLATLAICLPSFCIIFAISLFFDAFLSLTYVQYAFYGIRVCVIYLILSAGIKLLCKIEKKPLTIALIIITVLGMLTFSVLAISFSTIFYILIGGTVGLLAYLIARMRRRSKNDLP